MGDDRYEGRRGRRYDDDDEGGGAHSMLLTILVILMIGCVGHAWIARVHPGVPVRSADRLRGVQVTHTICFRHTDSGGRSRSGGSTRTDGGGAHTHTNSSGARADIDSDQGPVRPRAGHAT